MIPFALFALAGCIAIGSGSDRIMASDLFETAPAGIPAGPAPAPGAPRVFRVAELQRIAARLNLAASPGHDLCFERRLAPLDRVRMLAVMQRQLPEARIEIQDTSRFNVPEGEIEFPLAGLRQSPAGGFWSGAVRYAEGRRFVIWAKVKVLMPGTRVVAMVPLKAGQALGITELRLETRDGFPSTGVYAASIAEIAGKLLRRPVPRGAEIQIQWLEPASDVAQGNTVRVEVRSGAAVLEFEGKAATGGSVGQNIWVFNPSSKKRFQARVEGKGKVTVGKPLPSVAASATKGNP